MGPDKLCNNLFHKPTGSTLSWDAAYCVRRRGHRGYCNDAPPTAIVVDNTVFYTSPTGKMKTDALRK